MYVMLPHMVNFGGRVPVLTLKGFIAGDTIANLYTSYISTLKGYVLSRAASPVIVLDENPATDWAAYNAGVGAGNYTVALADSSTRYVSGIEALRVIITNAGGGNDTTVGIERDMGAAGVNWYAPDFISWCWYGSASTDTWRVAIVDAAGAWSYFEWDDTGATSWSRFLVRKDQLSVGAGVLDWKTVRYVRFYTAASGATRTNYMDRACIGVGVYVNFPGTRHDGIYLLNDMQAPEKGGVVRKVDYTMELLESDDFYGILSEAV